MKLPVFIILFLSKRNKIKQIIKRFDSKTDLEITEGYRDSVKWLNSLKKLYSDDFDTNSLVIKFRKHLNKRILPQMRRRGLNE